LTKDQARMGRAFNGTPIQLSQLWRRDFDGAGRVRRSSNLHRRLQSVLQINRGSALL
jgi:hypothetical protein